MSKLRRITLPFFFPIYLKQALQQMCPNQTLRRRSFLLHLEVYHSHKLNPNGWSLFQSRKNLQIHGCNQCCSCSKINHFWKFSQENLILPMFHSCQHLCTKNYTLALKMESGRCEPSQVCWQEKQWDSFQIATNQYLQ